MENTLGEKPASPRKKLNLQTEYKPVQEIVERTALQERYEQVIKYQKIGERYKDVFVLNELKYFEKVMKKIIEWNFKEPYCMSILSPSNGIGKTHLSIAMLKKYIWENLKRGFEITSQCFFKEYQVLNSIKSTYDDHGRVNEEEQKKIFINKPILVIDDLFRTKVTDWSTSIFYEIIDSRWDSMKPTIITSNFLIEEIAKIDTSIASRINNSMLFELTGNLEDKRI